MEDTKKIDAASTIKAIIQMGYSCEVVLTRLTKAEIEKYTRRTQRAPVKEVNKDSCVRKHLNSTSMKKKRARVIYSSDEESTGNSSDIESVKKKKKHGHIKHHNPEKTLHENSVLKNTENCSDKEKSTFINNINKSHSIQVCDLNEGPECPMEVRKEKYRRKFKLLFGDDYDDSDETEKRKSEYESRKHSSVPTRVSATINFDIYNDHVSVQTVSSVHKTSEKHLKENSYKHVHKSHKNKHKRKIEYDRTSKKSEIQRIEKLCTEVIKNDTVVEHLPKNSMKSDKSKSNNSSPKRNDSDNVDNTALLQGIWSSLGMQSPADRSDRIISNTLSETCTLYKAVNSKNDILLASGIAAELNKSRSVSLKVKYVNEKSSENDGTVPVETSFPIDNSQKMSLVNTGKEQLNKNKEIDSNNKSTIVQSGPTSDREDLVKRTIEVDENAFRPTEHDIKPECNIAESSKCTDSCNPVNASVLKSYHETEVSQTVRKSSSSEMCSTSAEKAAADEQHTENYHIIATDSENRMSRPVIFSIDLCDSADDTSRPEAFSSSGIPASVGSASGTESCSSCVIESVDEESNIGSCSSVEIVETGATYVTLVTCDSKPASEKNNNMSNTATSDSENHVGTSDINLVTSGSNAASDNSQSKSVLSESENLINSTVSNVSEERVSACNSENNTTINDGIVTNNNIGKIRVKDPKSLGIKSFGISNSDQSATAEIVVAPELRRQSIEEKRRHSVEEHRIQPVEVHRRRSVEDMTIEELIASGSSGQNLSESDILVFRNYKKYFNDLLESKLPKLGELLHLAVADSVRKDLRIHHSEKLSSPDLVKQEKMKAEKDFSDGLKARGIEFTALLDSIVKKFDLHCAEDMVFALYSRILDMFKLIDKQNKKHITRTRIIIQKMLQKNGYRNEIVYKILSMKTSDFSQSLSRISHCILTYNNMAKVAGNNNMSQTQPTLQSTQDDTSTIQTNSGIENMSDPKTVETNAQLLEKGTSGPIINVCSTSEPRAPINTTVQANSSSSPSDQHSSSNSFSWDAFFSKILEHPVDNRKQLTSDTATVASQHVTDFSYNRNPASYGHLPSYSSHLLPSVNNVGIVGNQNLSSAYYGSNAGNVNHINNLQTNNSVFDINRVSNSSVMHLQKSNDHTAGSMASAGNDLGRQNIGSHQQINNIQQINSSMNQQVKQIMRKHLVQLTPNSGSMNSTAVARNQSAVMQTNENNISLYKRIKNNRSNNQQCQNSLLSRQELNSPSSRTNNNHSKISNVVNSGGTDTLDRRSQKSDSSVMRNQNVMQPAGNVHSELINQNQAAVGIQRNSPYVNNVRQFHQMESSGRMAYTQAPVNWHARDLVINSGVMTTIPAASNLNYSPIQVNSNVNYSNQNTGSVVNRPSGSSVETTVQSNKLPQQQPNANVQNRSNALQPTGVIQRVNTGDLQQVAGNRPPPPPYSLTKSELLLQYLLKDNIGSLTYPESENLKKVVEDRVYSQNQSVLAGNHNMASRVVGQQNGNVPTWNLPRNVPLRPQDSQIGSISVQPNGSLLYNSVDTSVSNGNVPPNNVNTQKITVGANPNEISYQRIRQVGGVHNMKSHRNVQIAPRNVSKTQDRLPVISEVFTCGNFALPGQNMSTQNNDAASVTNTATNNITSHNASGNANCPSSLQSINSNVVTQLNNNTGRSPVVLTHSKEVPVSTYVSTVPAQNFQLLAPNKNTPSLMVSAVLTSTNAATTNYQLVYSQSVPQSTGYNFNTTSVVSNANSVGAYVSSPSVSLLSNNTDIVGTSSASSRQPASGPTSGVSSFDLPPSVIIQHLPNSVSDISEGLSITGDHVETESALESQDLTCARSGCNQKSSKLCSICKSSTYCSHECQYIYADSQGPCDNSVNQYSDLQLPDEYMDMCYLFSD